MATKVSELPLASVVNNEDYLMVVQGGVSKKATANKVKTPITVHDNYSVSAVEPYSARYVNEHLPSDYLPASALQIREDTSAESSYHVYACSYINWLAVDIRQSIPDYYVKTTYYESDTDMYSCNYINTTLSTLRATIYDYIDDNYLDLNDVLNSVDSSATSNTNRVYNTYYINTVLSGKADISSLATVATSGNYNDLTNKPTIPTVPTKLSDFTDDLGSNPTHTHSQYLTSQDISDVERTNYKVTTLSSSSTDAQYPSAKCVYDMIGNVETLLANIVSGNGVQ